jgi:hypothetical protein
VGGLAEDELSRRSVEPGSICASVVLNAETLVFTSTSPDPTSAQVTAQSYVEAYLEYRRTATLAELAEAHAPYEDRLRTIDEQLEELALQLREDPTDPLLSVHYAALSNERGTVIDKPSGFVTPDTLNIGDVIASPASRHDRPL